LRPRAQSLPRARHGFGEPFLAEGFQQVVDRVHVEGGQCVLIVRGREHDRHRAPQQLQHLEATELRHLHVQKQEVWRQLRHGFHGFEAVGAFRDHLHSWMPSEVLTYDRPRQGLVVHDHDPHPLGF
jgi:hypothetical protein